MSFGKNAARIAGFWYLLVAIFGSFAALFVEPRLYVSGDAAATVQNILASEGLFRLGVVANLVTTVCFLFLADALYKLFKSVDKDLVRLMVLLIMASVPIAYLETLKFAPMLLLGRAGYLSAFEPAQLQALAMVFLDMTSQGLFIAKIFYGLWMFPLGLLVFKSGSGFIPKVLGVLLIVACFGYLGDFLNAYMALHYGAIAALGMNIAIVAEILTILWLLIKGPKDQQPASLGAS